MKELFLSVLIFTAALNDLNAQTTNGNEEAKVNEAITKLFNGIAGLNVEMMRQSTTKDFLLLEDGAVWNMDTLLKKLNPLKATSFSRTNHLEFIRTNVDGHTAWVAYNNAADISINEKKMWVQWLESAVLVKEGGKWKISLLHSTKLNPKAQ